MLPPATASHHHCVLPGHEVSIIHTDVEILQGAKEEYHHQAFYLHPIII